MNVPRCIGTEFSSLIFEYIWIVNKKYVWASMSYWKYQVSSTCLTYQVHCIFKRSRKKIMSMSKVEISENYLQISFKIHFFKNWEKANWVEI